MKERKTGYYLAKYHEYDSIYIVYIVGRFNVVIEMGDSREWDIKDYYWISETPLNLESLCDKPTIVPDYIERGLSDVD